MPLQPGEVSLVTLFADVHTYLSPPSSRPVHHRFDRRSYLYLYHDPIHRRGRLELANNAGTPDQDAFSGFLDSAKIEYSYKQPTLFTITADSRGQGSPQNDMSQWHIPAFDPRNENKYMYKINSVDIYLWKADDASLMLDSLRRVLQPSQLVLSDVPITEHRDSVSPVVQQLEHMAVSSHGQQRTGSVSTTNTALSFPPPPPQPSNGTPVNQPQSPPASQQTFAPMAYNPAAPAAPEQRVHREKTPPPPDAEAGTGLTAAAQHEHVPQQFGGPPQGGFGPQQSSYMPGPPSMSTPQPGIHRTQTMPQQSSSPFQSFAPPPQATPPQDPNAHLYAQQPGTPGLQRQSTMPYQPGQQSAPTQYASYPASSGPGAPLQSPGFAPLQSPGFTPQPTSQSYSQTSQPNQGYGQQNHASINHSMHTQFYTPEGSAQQAQAGPGQQPGKMDHRMEKLEKGFGRFLKKIDQKF